MATCGDGLTDSVGHLSSGLYGTTEATLGNAWAVVAQRDAAGYGCYGGTLAVRVLMQVVASGVCG